MSTWYTVGFGNGLLLGTLVQPTTTPRLVTILEQEPLPIAMVSIIMPIAYFGSCFSPRVLGTKGKISSH